MAQARYRVVERTAPNGVKVKVWERRVPRVWDRLLGAVVYLYEDRERAEKGVNVGGSGFIVGQRARASERIFLYVVTCDHVAMCGAPVVRSVTRDGKVEITEPEWIQHPLGDDVAIAPFRVIPVWNSMEYIYSFIDRKNFLTREDLQTRSMEQIAEAERGEVDFPWGELVGVGDDTVTIGRFLGKDGGETNVPTARFGNIASANVVTVHENERAFDQESLLVEARSLNGYSGSAVFTYHNIGTWGGWSAPIGTFGDVFRLLGIDFGHLMVTVDTWPHEWEAVIAVPGKPFMGRLNSGMMTVVPAWKIAEVLDSEAAVETEDRQEKHDDDVELDDAAFESDMKPSVTRGAFMRDLRKVTKPVDKRDESG